MIDLAAGLEERADVWPCETIVWSSCRLWSLWDMLDKYAWWFFILAELLTQLRRDLGLPPPLAFTPPPSLTGLGSLASVLSLESGNPSVPSLPAPISDSDRERIGSTLGWVIDSCLQIGLVGISKDIERARNDAGGLFLDRQKLRFHVEHITNRIVDELEEQLFLHIPAEKARYYRVADLFGPQIGAKFPQAREDLTNAGTGYALGLNTSCVFHLMRVLEHCVQRFGRKLKITAIDVRRETWYQIMLHVHKQVEALPGGVKATVAQAKRKQRFAVAASRLDHVRIAWRNDVMHPRATYDEKESLDVLTSVRAFLESIVNLV
jgi:hypothetical protein